jgi:hypothetical protein
MPAVIPYSNPTAHPSFIREQREITAILIRSLILRGRPEQDARREAEAILAPMPVRREPSRRRFTLGRGAGA